MSNEVKKCKFGLHAYSAGLKLGLEGPSWLEGLPRTVFRCQICGHKVVKGRHANDDPLLNWWEKLRLLSNIICSWAILILAFFVIKACST